MVDRGNIAVIQSEDRKEQVWFYGHWSGWRMPAVLQHAIREGKERWTDYSYFARIVFCRLIGDGDAIWARTSFGISTCIGDNEHPIMVADCLEQRVYKIEEDTLIDGKVPPGKLYGPSWTFEEYSLLTNLPWGTLEGHLKEVGQHPEPEAA